MAWVSTTGNDSTGAVNNQSQPYRTIGPAVTAIQAANGGKADGGIVYLNNGTYGLGNATTNTTNEWLTIARASGATKSEVIINAAGTVRSTRLLKLDGVTLKSDGVYDYVIVSEAPVTAWINDCDLHGSGRWVSGGEAIHQGLTNLYFTNSSIYTSKMGFAGRPLMVRGATLNDMGEDAFQNAPFVINCIVDGIDNGTTGVHADAYQFHTTGVPPAENRIIYGLKAIDLHYQGIFARADAGTAANNALVNILIEMRSPASPNESGAIPFTAMSFYHGWDHLLVWNNTIIHGSGAMSFGTLTNASFIGNVFWHFIDPGTVIKDLNPAWSEPGNANNNEFLYNHLENVYGVTPSKECTPNDPFIRNSYPCPHWYAKRPDSDSGVSSTVGEGELTIDYTSSDFGKPVAGSQLLDRFLSKVPCDLVGNARGATSDVGAYERNTESGVNIPTNFNRVTQ
jgi:hypothetical protein